MITYILKVRYKYTYHKLSNRSSKHKENLHPKSKIHNISYQIKVTSINDNLHPKSNTEIHII
jgi:hypothetical protein